MNDAGVALWTLEELEERVAAELGGPNYAGVANGRIRDVPDLRTIRYYTALGLVDRPLALRNRKGLYGVRHLLQLVAIKRLQARGMSLAAIQECLLGITDAALRQLVDPRFATPEGRVPSPAPAPMTKARTENVWRGSVPVLAQTSTTSTSAPIDEERAAQTTAAVVSVYLGDEMVLSLAPRRPLEQEDVRLIRTVAAPLIEVLKLRELIDVSPTNRPGGDSQCR
jgi:hypothetical protein